MENILGRIQQNQDLLHKHRAQTANCQENAPEDQAEQSQNIFEFLRPAHPKPLGGQNRQPGGEAHYDHDKHAVGRCNRADSGQGQLPLHIAHNESVHPVEQLLKHAAEDQGHGERRQRLGNAALGHIMFHSNPSQLIWQV